VNGQLALVIAQLAQVDDRFALPTQVQVRDLAADVRHPRVYLVSKAQLLLLARRLFAFQKQRSEVGALIRSRMREGRLRHRTSRRIWISGRRARRFRRCGGRARLLFRLS